MGENTKAGKEITIGEFLGKIGSSLRYALAQWRIVLLFALFCGLMGLCYSIFRKTKYTAVSTFVLEDESKSGMLSQYSGLASLAGIDLNSGSMGLFQGDNILELYKSRTMIEKTLLSDAVIDGKNQLLIERYIDFNNLRKKWKSHDDIAQIDFNGDPTKFDRAQDSIITDIVKTFNKHVLEVNKLDKKLSIIVVEVTIDDEPFAAAFTKKLEENVNTFYIQTKIKKSAENVAVLQHQADSVKQILDRSIGGVASAMESAPNANPQLMSLKVPSEKKQVDVQTSSAVYGEIVKNLELAKISLRQDIPLIQVIDQPVLPLENDRVSKIKGSVFGFLLGLLIITCGLTLKRAISG